MQMHLRRCGWGLKFGLEQRKEICFSKLERSTGGMVLRDRYKRVSCEWGEEEPKVHRRKAIYSAYKKFAAVVCADLCISAEFAFGA